MKCKAIYIIILSSLLSLIPQAGMASDIPGSHVPDDKKEAASGKNAFGFIPVTAVSTDVTCYGGSNGTGTVTFVGGTPPYTYQWKDNSLADIPGATDSTITGLSGGFYYVWVKDSKGNFGQDNIFIANGPNISLITFPEDVQCKDADDGEIFISAASGDPGRTLQYSIDSGYTYGSGFIFSDLAPGDYYIAVKDNLGCKKYDAGNPYTIIEPPGLNITLNDSSNLTCYESADGFIKTTITGGTTPYDITWDGPDPDPPSDSNIYALAAGDYDLLVTDFNNCTATIPTVTLTQPPPIVITVIDVQDATCSGYSNGSIDISVTGGTQPYSFAWSGPAGPYPDTKDLTNLIAGDYTLLVTDGNGCTQGSGTITVDEPFPLIITVDSIVQISCNGETDGAIYVTTDGGTLNYSYTWTGTGMFTSTDEDIKNLPQGAYETIVTDSHGCKDTLDTQIVLEPAAIVITDGTITHVSCNGGSDGEIDVNVAGGTTPYSYSWVGPSYSSTSIPPISGLKAGTYTLTVTDSRGCELIHTPIDITEPPLLEITGITPTDITCKDSDDGEIDITFTGGTAPYTFAWNGPAGPYPDTADLTNLEPGDYDLTITDDKSCNVNSGTITLIEPGSLIISIDSVIDISCNGSIDGAIYVTTTGGNPGYTYAWTGPGVTVPTDSNQVGLSQGDYSTIVTDTKGCKDTLPTTTINEPAVIVITDGPITHVSCNGGNDGSIEVNVIGGTAPYSYSWDGPDPYTSTSNLPITGLYAGTYTLTITDNRECQEVHVVNLTEPPLLEITGITPTDITCKDSDDGEINVAFTGGTAPYSLTWNGPAGPYPDAADLTNLEPGDYDLTITDAKSCYVNSGTITLIEPDSLLISIDSVIHISCNGLTDGAIYVSTDGGNPGYTYAWTGPGVSVPTDQYQIGLSQGDYKTVVTDTKGCKDSIPTTTINEPVAIVITDGPITHVSCNGGSDGEIDVNVAGGTAPYSYSWVGASYSSTSIPPISGLKAGTYTLTLTDSRECQEVHVVNLTEPPGLVITTDSVNDVTCNGLDDGDIYTTISGGTPGYILTWTGPAGPYPATAALEDIEPGTYKLDMTDAKGCPATTGNITINEPVTLVATLVDTIHISCNGADNGAINISVAGGTAPISFTWTGPGIVTPTNEDQAGLSPGDYDVVITDANGCIDNLGTYNIKEPTAINIIQDSIHYVTCSGDTDGAVYITPSGGTLPYSFSWTGPGLFSSAAEDITSLAAGDYTLILTDGNGCKNTLGPVTVSQPGLLTAIIDSVFNVTCFGAHDGAVYISANGGTTPYSYAWTDSVLYNKTDEDITGLTPANYYVLVTDSNGCSVQLGPMGITEPFALSVVTDDTTMISCFGANDGSISITVSGGTLPYIYEWTGTGGYNSSAQDIVNLKPGAYECKITDANDCEVLVNTIPMFEPPKIVISNDSLRNISCFGGNDGYIYVDVTGGVLDYTYSWSSPGGFTSADQDVDTLSADIYRLKVTDSEGCIANYGPDTLTQPDALAVVVDSTRDITCKSDSNGEIYISVSGGVLPYSFNWTGPGVFTSSNEDITSLPPGDYDLTLTDANSCIYNLPTITITEPDSLLVSLDSLKYISCFGVGNGAIYVAVAGGTMPYLYAWDGPGVYTSGDKDINSLQKGDYDLIVSDINGCSYTLPTQTIVEPDSIWVSVVDSTSVLELDCFGDSDGNIQITVAGGTGSFTFNWAGPGGYNSTNEDIINLSAGLYNLTVTDAEGCSRDFMPLDSITEPDKLELSLVSSDITCFGDNNGNIEAVATGGTRPYQYSRNGIVFNSDSVFTNLTPGTKIIYLRDINSCKTSDTTKISQPAELRITNELRDDTGNKCFGDSNGIITITAMGGSLPYEYSIDSMDTWQTDRTFTGIPAGTYYTFVRDTNGCADKGSQLVVSQPAEIKIITYIQVDIDSTSCYTSPEGQIFINVSGGVGTIDYILDGGVINQTGSFNGVTGGPHLIEMVDQNGCAKDTTIVIKSPPLIKVDSSTITDIAGCFGDSTGVIEIVASGGTGVLDYAINGGTFQDSAIFVNLPAGTHIITIRDDNNCEVYPSFVITQPDTIGTTSLIVNPVTCNGDTNGSILVTGYGGTAPYTYTLYPDLVSDTIGNFTNLPPGDYGISVDDANGCPTYFSPGLKVIDPETLLVDSVLSQEMACYGTDDGTISIFAQGGMGQLMYSIDNGTTFDSIADFNSLPGNTYFVVVEDSLGCSVRSDTIDLPEPPDIIIDSIKGIDVIPCAGDNTGSIIIAAHGGTGVLNYSIDNDTWQVVDTFPDLPAENYTVWIEDADGCTRTSNTVTINEPEVITANITVLHSFNGEPGEINISASGGEGDLEYSITGIAGPYLADTLYTGLWPGDYTVAVRDDLGCVYTEIATIDASPPLEIDVSFTNIDCNGDGDGTITLTSINGTGVVNYSIDDRATSQTDGAYTGLGAGIYIIYVYDEDHRFFKDTIEITEPVAITLGETITPATCSDIVSDGAISLTVSGGMPDYSYLWSTSDTTKDLNNITAGNYSVTVTDNRGCTTIGNFEVISTVEIIANAGNDMMACYGDQLILNASGGTTYFWQPETGLSNPGIANPVVTVTDSMTYILTVTEPGGCYGRDTINIAPYPYLGIDAGNDTTVAVGQTIQMSASGGQFDSYSWIPLTGFDDPTNQSPFLTVTTDQVFYVTGTTINGCTEYDSVIISTASELIIYSGFTPNGDGINDYWDIDNVLFYPNITIEVYNRWGALIFSSKGYSSENRWDGTYNGKEVPIGTYYYFINLNDGSKIIKGHVTIVR